MYREKRFLENSQTGDMLRAPIRKNRLKSQRSRRDCAKWEESILNARARKLTFKRRLNVYILLLRKIDKLSGPTWRTPFNDHKFPPSSSSLWTSVLHTRRLAARYHVRRHRDAEIIRREARAIIGVKTTRGSWLHACIRRCVRVIDPSTNNVRIETTRIEINALTELPDVRKMRCCCSANLKR